MTELQQFLAMLRRAGVGHSTRRDYTPDGTAVLVETGEGETELMVTEFAFDAAGRLVGVECYPGDAG